MVPNEMIAAVGVEIGRNLISIMDHVAPVFSSVMDKRGKLVQLNLLAMLHFHAISRARSVLSAAQCHAFTIGLLVPVVDRFGSKPGDEVEYQAMFASRIRGFEQAQSSENIMSFCDYFLACCNTSRIEIEFADIRLSSKSLEITSRITGMTEDLKKEIERANTDTTKAYYEGSYFMAEKLFPLFVACAEETRELVEKAMFKGK